MEMNRNSIIRFLLYYTYLIISFVDVILCVFYSNFLSYLFTEAIIVILLSIFGIFLSIYFSKKYLTSYSIIILSMAISYILLLIQISPFITNINLFENNFYLTDYSFPFTFIISRPLENIEYTYNSFRKNIFSINFLLITVYFFLEIIFFLKSVSCKRKFPQS